VFQSFFNIIKNKVGLKVKDEQSLVVEYREIGSLVKWLLGAGSG
jgi:hypothetical protein